MISRRVFLAGSAALAVALPVFAQQPASRPTGGAGGRIIRVTTLKPDGPGSITEAIKATGARIVVFEVGGVIDLGRSTLRITRGDLTIAGETAPSPGITLIKGGIEIGQDCRNVVITHIAVRPGEAGAGKTSGWECDGIYAYGASNILIRNCSITWATDEGLSASGKRFGIDNAGASVADWRAATSHDIFFLNNIVAEGLSNATHSKGEHSKGTLIHDNVRNALIADSLYAHNMERNILFKGGTQGVMTRCIVYNPGKRFAHYNLHDMSGRAAPGNRRRHRLSPATSSAVRPPIRRPAAFVLGGEHDLRCPGQASPARCKRRRAGGIRRVWLQEGEADRALKPILVDLDYELERARPPARARPSGSRSYRRAHRRDADQRHGPHHRLREGCPAAIKPPGSRARHRRSQVEPRRCGRACTCSPACTHVAVASQPAKPGSIVS